MQATLNLPGRLQSDDEREPFCSFFCIKTLSGKLYYIYCTARTHFYLRNHKRKECYLCEVADPQQVVVSSAIMHPLTFTCHVNVLFPSWWRLDWDEPGGEPSTVGQKDKLVGVANARNVRPASVKHGLWRRTDSSIGFRSGVHYAPKQERLYGTHVVIFNTDKSNTEGWEVLENRESVDTHLGLQKNLYWMRSVTANMSAPWMDMAHRFLPTMSQLRGSWKRSSPEKQQHLFNQHT